MILRCLKHQSHIFKRSISISPRTCSFTGRVKDFFLAHEKENFDEECVKKAHEWDGVDQNKWTIIYRDLGASRTFFMTAAFLPAFIVGCGVVCADIMQNNESQRMDFVQRLVSDANELGILVYIPAFALTLVVAMLVRVQQIRLLRVYQNKKDVDRYVAIRSRMILGQKRHEFRRDESTAFYYAEEQTDGKRVVLNFLFGNIQIDSSRFMIMDEMFRGNNYRSYMLNETSVPPRL